MAGVNRGGKNMYGFMNRTMDKGVRARSSRMAGRLASFIGEIHQPFQPHPGTWSSPEFLNLNTVPPPNFNRVTGQFLPLPDNKLQLHPNGDVKMHSPHYDRNDHMQQLSGVSYYADAVLKGPRLEIPLFDGEDPIGWLQQCEKFFDMSGTPYEQWVNIATWHFYGRENTWLKNICVPWQMVNWQQFCQMIADRFTQANAHEAVERLKNIQQTSSVQTYIDQFEECVQLVHRDHHSPIPSGSFHHELFYWRIENRYLYYLLSNLLSKKEMMFRRHPIRQSLRPYSPSCPLSPTRYMGQAQHNPGPCTLVNEHYFFPGSTRSINNNYSLNYRLS
jgi:hypothetical protein